MKTSKEEMRKCKEGHFFWGKRNGKARLEQRKSNWRSHAYNS